MGLDFGADVCAHPSAASSTRVVNLCAPVGITVPCLTDHPEFPAVVDDISDYARMAPTP